MPKRELLTDDQIAEGLKVLGNWQRDGAALLRTAKLGSFPEAIQVVNRIAEIAERDDHHPDIDIRWRTLIFRCTTHCSGGISALDLSLASKIDQVLSEYL